MLAVLRGQTFFSMTSFKPTNYILKTKSLGIGKKDKEHPPT